MLCPIVNLTRQLIQCPSLSPFDAGCQALIIKRLQAIGFTINCLNFDDTNNFWAWRGQGETLAFIGHTDVVPTGNTKLWINPPFESVIHNGILFGRGAADMKGALAAMIVAVERFVKQYPNHRGRLAFLITSDEETNARNGIAKVVKVLMKQNEKLDYCLIGEPSSNEILGDVIKTGRRGSLTCNLVIHGIQGHIAYHHLADNPVHRAIPILNELLSIKWDNGNNFFPPTNMQIANIKAGIGNNNIIPGNLYVQFNFRFSTELTDELIKKRFTTLLKKYNLHYTTNWFLSGKPFLTPHGKLLDAVINSITYYNKIKPELSTSGGTSDGRFIAEMGSQIVELGLVNSSIHKINECVKVSDLQLLANIYQLVIEQVIA